MNTENNSIGELMEPDAIGFSFGAPGWNILLLLFLAVLFGIALWKLYQYKKNKYRRLAINELNSINKGQNEASYIILNTISILKRVAITAYGRNNIASINGSRFLEFMQTKTRIAIFTNEVEKIFTKHLYEGSKTHVAADKLELLHQQSMNWINQHHV